jgi:hypothetical protein
MTWNGLYAFDAADAELTLLPMAARRALDRAGLHLSLRVWQTLPLATRRGLIGLGAAAELDVGAVAAQLTAAGASVREQAPSADPAPDRAPSEVVALLGADAPGVVEHWPRLRALDRFVLAQLSRRAKRERALEAAAEILAARERDAPG